MKNKLITALCGCCLTIAAYAMESGSSFISEISGSQHNGQEAEPYQILLNLKQLISKKEEELYFFLKEIQHLKDVMYLLVQQFHEPDLKQSELLIQDLIQKKEAEAKEAEQTSDQQSKRISQ